MKQAPIQFIKLRGNRKSVVQIPRSIAISEKQVLLSTDKGQRRVFSHVYMFVTKNMGMFVATGLTVKLRDDNVES